ncbi:hypothetical protein BS50DRAFT_567178 [Corynespora cassiicola Philippines]|uniref:Uncharacterized protein n=1 Tax=Corynespora cassiicola Philippines TaxID=1448308 RepID=A0A2T2P9J2_CORCC|nr:hypothetical protein BS50DRAFT_567178 [Corynespora cassiicola Philippines]
MDHWGDPWADDADDKSTTKSEIEVKPPPTTISSGPVILNGFLDDAQWGSAEDEGTAWTNEPASTSEAQGWGANEEIDAVPEPILSKVLEEDLAVKDSGTLGGISEWGHIADDWPQEPEKVVSDTSDSATTIQPEDVPEPSSPKTVETLHPEDDLSTRPSTSPSDISHTEAPSESPRTSFEDERTAPKPDATETTTVSNAETKEELPDTVDEKYEDEATAERDIADDDFGDFEDNEEENNALRKGADNADDVEVPSSPGDDHQAAEHLPDSEPQPPGHTPQADVAFGWDTGLLTQLFPPAQEANEPSEAPDDPISTTSTRKAWYRLTRKQTMREFNNNGNDDDNYIRVTWATSHIRSEVNKIVGRWATEDRIAGRGPGARASFYWDQGAAPDPKPLHAHIRKKSSISSAKSTPPANQSVQPLSTNIPAAFNWSSPSTSTGPGLGENSRSVSSPVTAKHSAIAKIQRQEGRAVSVDLTPRTKDPTHKRSATEFNFDNSPVPLAPSPKQTSPSLTDGDPWSSTSSPKTAELPTFNPQNNEEDEEDEWGDMVQSPAVGTPTTEFFSIPPPPIPSTPIEAPKSISPAPPPPPGSKNASPIVRLKGTVSPTSAVFRYNSFVPDNVETGPIGPNILKPASRSREGTPEKKRPGPILEAKHQSSESIDAGQNELQKQSVEVDNSIIRPSTELKDSSPLETTANAIVPAILPLDSTALEPSASPPMEPQPPADSWDFSIFESSVPTTSTPIPQPTPPDPSDPWSIFETPAPPSNPTPEPNPAPFARPPVHSVTPPPPQPLTGATNSVQKRKVEEDETIRSIIAGLPDLRYMVR